MTNYYIKSAMSCEIKDRHHRELQALDNNYDHYHKYQTEYKIHYWLPPVTLEPPRDNSIEDLTI